jgi:hypothetical protein
MLEKRFTNIGSVLFVCVLILARAPWTRAQTFKVAGGPDF